MHETPTRGSGLVWLSDDDVLGVLRANVTGAESTWLHPSIPPKKAANARKIHAAHLPADEEILGIYDGTAFGSAKDGWIVTAKRVCWKNQMEGAAMLPWQHVDPDGIYVDDTQVVIGPAKLDSLYSEDDDGLYAWAAALQVLARSARGEREDDDGAAPPTALDPAWGDASIVVATAGAGGAAWGGMHGQGVATEQSWDPERPDTEQLAGAPFSEDRDRALVDVHASGTLVLVAAEETLELRDASNGQRRLGFSVESCVTCAQFSADGSWIVAGADDGRVHLFEVASGRIFGSTPETDTGIEAVEWLGESTRFVAAHSDGSVVMYDASSMQAIHRFVGPSDDGVGDAAISRDGARLFISTGDRIGAFDTASGRALWRLDEGRICRGKLAISPAGDVLAAADESAVAIFDARSGEARGRHPFRCAHSVSWPTSGGGILGGLVQGSRDDDDLRSWAPHPRFSPGGDTIAVQNPVGNLVLIDMSTSTPYPTARAACLAWIEDIAWFPSGGHIVVTTTDNRVSTWAVRPLALVLDAPGIPRGAY